MQIRFRSSLPAVTPHSALPTTVLTNSRQDLHKVQVSALPQGAITLRALSYRIGGDDRGTWFTLSNFQGSAGFDRDAARLL
jgi:hypothetical protein